MNIWELGSTCKCYFILESGGGVGDANKRGDQYCKSHAVKVSSTVYYGQGVGRWWDDYKTLQ